MSHPRWRTRLGPAGPLVVVRPLLTVGSEYVPWASSGATRKVMQGNRRRDTKPELAIRCAAHALGMRYRVDERPLPNLNRRADMVFARARVAVFIDGCYWHGCPEHGTRPTTNREYWSAKIGRNVARDRETDSILIDAGWLPLRVWEHEDVDAVVSALAETVRVRVVQSRNVTGNGTGAAKHGRSLLPVRPLPADSASKSHL